MVQQTTVCWNVWSSAGLSLSRVVESPGGCQRPEAHLDHISVSHLGATWCHGGPLEPLHLTPVVVDHRCHANNATFDVLLSLMVQTNYFQLVFGHIFVKQGTYLWSVWVQLAKKNLRFGILRFILITRGRYGTLRNVSVILAFINTAINFGRR